MDTKYKIKNVEIFILIFNKVTYMIGSMSGGTLLAHSSISVSGSEECENAEDIEDKLKQRINLENQKIKFNFESVKREEMLRIRSETFQSAPFGMDRYTEVRPFIGNCLNAPYLNASMIELDKKMVVAAQAPLPHTFAAFYTNIVLLGTKIILMLTKLEENGKIKADKYWPDFGCTDSYNTNNNVLLTVKNVKEIQINDVITIRKLQIIIGSCQPSYLTHIHYTGWPDFGIPDDNQIIDLYRLMYIFIELKPIVPIIHCSAGIGRTGTFISIYRIMMSKVIIDLKEFIMETVILLRRNRIGMVQTIEQYELIHRIFKFKQERMTARALSKMDIDKLK